MRHRAQQPVPQVRVAVDLRQRTVHLQEHVLRQLLGIGAAPGEAQRDAEHPTLVRPQQFAERDQIPGARPLQAASRRGDVRGLIHQGQLGERCIHMNHIRPVPPVRVQTAVEFARS
jgi:hypothetical protein